MPELDNRNYNIEEFRNSGIEGFMDCDLKVKSFEHLVFECCISDLFRFSKFVFRIYFIRPYSSSEAFLERGVPEIY
jgi:hypothetical protein